tara:strand:+ start:363 stop:602 length:240 start_codon:yes stop_codon:yes gene_type:complete
MDYRKQWEERVSKKRINELTIEDKKIIVKYNLSEAISCFHTALYTATELDYRFVEDCMSEAKNMVYMAEEEGADIGSFN